MKKIIILITIIIITGIGIFVFDQMKYTTYEEVISDIETINEADTFRKMIITNPRTDETLDDRFCTEDMKLIQKILEKPSDMKLKKHRQDFIYDYSIAIFTNKGTCFFHVDENNLDTCLGSGDTYKIIGENKLYQLVEELRNEKSSIR